MTSLTNGILFISIFLSLKIVEAKIGSVAFFEPEILIVPDKVLLPLIINFALIKFLEE